MNETLKNIIIYLVITIIVFYFGFKFFKEDPKKEDVIDYVKYEIIVNKLYYLDSLLSLEQGRVDNLYKKSEDFKNEYKKHNANKINKNSIVIPDTSSLLRELSEFTK